MPLNLSFPTPYSDSRCLVSFRLVSFRFVLLQVPPQDKALVDKLVAAQDAAKAARLRMWQYGDMGESDDEI